MFNRNRHSKIKGHLKNLWKVIAVVSAIPAIQFFINVLVRLFKYLLILFTYFVDLMIDFAELVNTFVNSIFIYKEVSYGYY